jgi:hypothetical protein
MLMRSDQSGKSALLFADRSLLEDFAQILRLSGSEFSTAHFIKNDQIELGDFLAVANIAAA